MAWQIPDSTTKPGPVIDLGNNDSLLVNEDVRLMALGGVTVRATGNAQVVRVLGLLDTTSFGGAAISFEGTGTGATVVIGTTGSVMGDHAIRLTNLSSRLDNSGTIESFDTAIEVAALGSGGTTRLVNKGSIIVESEDGWAVHRSGTTSREAVDLVNTGSITGRYEDASTKNAVDRITNSGSYTGEILLGGGNDSYDGRQGTITGTVHGGSGNDTLLGSAGVETFVGEIGNDVLDGGSGQDNLDGGAGNDTLIGGRDGDMLTGGDGFDTASYATATRGLRVDLLEAARNTVDAKGDAFISIENLTGSAFEDALNGDNSANALSGGGGADTLVGRGGRDVLTGGTGADLFVFRVLADTTVASSGRDTVVDFSRSQGDKLDLSGIDALAGQGGNEAFNFIGTAAFTKTAGELRFVTGDDYTLVQGDVNGDGKADFAILLDGILTLKASDFML